MITSKLGKLIVVDDEIDTLTPLCDLLSEWGYEVKGFTSGKDALEALKEKDSDMLLTDLVMPEMDGIELMKAAMEMDPLLVCMIITGKGTIQTAVEAMKNGAFDYILKPIEWKMLNPIISRAMETRRLRESEKKYRSIVEDQTELICRWKPGEILTFVNEPYCRYFNKNPEELIGHSFMPLIPEENWEDVRKHFASLGPENPVSTHEHRVINPNGEIRWQKWTNRALFDDQGHIAEFQSVGHDITERKKIEEALEQEQYKLREYFENLPLLAYNISFDGTIVDCNNVVLRRLGYESKEELIGKPVIDTVYAPLSQEKAKQLLEKWKREKTLKNEELQIVTKQGKIFDVLLNVDTIYDQNGTPLYSLSTQLDITERKKAEDKLRKSEEKYRTLFEGIFHGIIVADIETGQYIEVNPAACKALGYSEEEIKAVSQFKGIHPKEETERIKRFFYAQAKGEINLAENIPFVHKNGTIHYFDVGSVIMEVEGVQRVVGLLRDITERKKAEEELQKSEARYRDLYDNAPDMYHTIDENGVILNCNETEAKMLGYKKEEIIGRPVTDFFTEESKRLYEISFPQLREKKTLFNLEREFVRKDGTTFPASLNVFSVYDKNRKFIGTKTIARDISVLKQAESALRDSEEKYRTLVDNALVGVYKTNLKGDFLFVNEALARIIEFDSPEEMTAESVPKRYKDPKDREVLIGKLRGNNKVENFEVDLLTKTGETRNVLLSATLEGDTISGMIMDITERKKAENALKESEERFRSLTEAAYEGIVFHKEGILLIANDQISMMFGYELDELLGKNIVQILVAPEAREFMKEQIANGKPGPYESIGVKKDGTRFPMEIRARQAELKGQNIRVATVLDITERKRAEEALRESEGKLNAMLQSIGDHMSMIDKNLNIIWANDIARKIFGDEIIGKKCYEVYHRRKKPCEPYPCLTLKAFQDEKVHEHEVQIIGKTAEITYFHCTANVALRDKEGKPAAVIEISRNITERKQAEEELKKSHKQLRAIAARITEVEETERRRITQELHDYVGQNLTALDINLNILPSLLSVKSKTGISNRLEDMHKLLGDTVKKIRDVMAALRPSVLDDYGLMAALRWYSEQFSNRTGITTVVQGKELKPRMPSIVETTLFRIAQESLTNVSKHAQASKVIVKLTKKDNLVQLSIADDGIGFDPEKIQRLKEKYVWGLISMKERAVAMGGELYVKSKPGKGTTIIVEIKRTA
jgi:PAS domain S-box-containing protein